MWSQYEQSMRPRCRHQRGWCSSLFLAVGYWDIFSAAAVALLDPYLGEKICAAVVFVGEPVSLAELNAHLDERGVATHARPDMLVAMAALPTTPIGKIDKKAIARQVGDVG
jgi:mycobactin salicyl-AMP ligase